MNAPADASVNHAFREGLRRKRVALRSGMHLDDIDEVEIVQGDDLDVAATRQVLKVGLAVDGTDEINAADVLEAIAIVAPEQAWTTLDDEDAFSALNEPISTSGVTLDFDQSGLPHASPARQRRLGWVVGTVVACCVALLVGEAVAGSLTSSAPSSSASAVMVSTAVAQSSSVTPVSLTTTAGTATAMASVDVSSLRGAPDGTIVAPPRSALFVDGKRMRGTTALVACGKHIVKTSRKSARRVDVPCGGQVDIR